MLQEVVDWCTLAERGVAKEGVWWWRDS